MPYKIGIKWKAQVRRDGQRMEKTFNTRKEAISWEVEMRKKPVSDWIEKTDTVCLGDWAGSYLDFAQIKFSEKTYKEKKAMFKRLCQEVPPELSVTELTPKIVMDYILVQSQQRSGYAANKDRKNLIAAWNWGMKYMAPPLSGPNPCVVERMPEIRYPRYVPPEEDFWKVYDVAEGQDKIMLLTYLNTAARRAEIFRLKWADINFSNGLVRLGTYKRADGTLEYNWLPMTDELFNTLLAHKQNSDPEFVFLNPETGKPYVERKRWMNGLCNIAKVMPFGVHAIRHLSASILAQNGVPSLQIQAILRHKKLSTTEKYLHQTENLKLALTMLGKKKKPSMEPSTENVIKMKSRVA